MFQPKVYPHHLLPSANNIKTNDNFLGVSGLQNSWPSSWSCCNSNSLLDSPSLSLRNGIMKAHPKTQLSALVGGWDFLEFGEYFHGMGKNAPRFPCRWWNIHDLYHDLLWFVNDLPIDRHFSCGYTWYSLGMVEMAGWFSPKSAQSRHFTALAVEILQIIWWKMMLRVPILHQLAWKLKSLW